MSFVCDGLRVRDVKILISRMKMMHFEMVHVFGGYKYVEHFVCVFVGASGGPEGGSPPGPEGGAPPGSRGPGPDAREKRA